MNAHALPSIPYFTRVCSGLSLIAMLSIAPAAVAAGYTQHNLVTDDQQNLVNSGYAPAGHVDPNLINPWGISQGPTSPFWVSDNGTGLSTLYNGSGTPIPLVVTIPGLGGNPGTPTGQVFNGDTSSFTLPGGAARFLFATEDGTISGWNSGTNAVTEVDNSPAGAVYKGLAIDNAVTPGNSLLYAANFGGSRIDVFNHNFASIFLPGSFVDPNLPNGYAPFNIQNLNGELYITYAFKAQPSDKDETAGAGLGIVDLFDTQGQFLKRLVSPGSVLDSPWGLALAPSGFGQFGGDLLVGNFGDGKINAFDSNGVFMGALSDPNGAPISIDGLWGLAFGNGANSGSKDTLYFAAGINGEAHGLFGSLNAVPEPATLPMTVLGLVLACIYTRQSKRGGFCRRLNP